MQPAKSVLITSNPPRKIMTPKTTTICINNFFFEENFIAKYENITKGKPRKDGIQEVADELPLIKLTMIPQAIKKKP